jgi:predicted regulator of Ras-like GTPase activity (Roadblock/LC7/MglB family)
MAEDNLLAEMQALRDKVTGITGTAVASRDGLIIREDTGGVDPDNLAALTATALSLAQRIASEAGQGTLREAVTRSSGGYVAIYAVGSSAVLVLIGDEGLDIARLHRESRAAVDNIETILALVPALAAGTGSGRPQAADRHVQDLRGMRDLDVLAPVGQRGRDLQRAAGIRGDEQRRARGQDRVRLAGA